MNKNNLNKVIKKGAIVIAASLATMSLFGCNSKVEGNKTYTTYPIDQDEEISNGDKIVTKVEETKVPETKVEETKIEETTTAGSLNVGSIDFNTVETYNNEAEISDQIKANRNKRKTGNSYGYTKEYIKNMKIPDYLLANGDTENSIRNRLNDYDYLWEYMEDPANFKVDYSLSDKEFSAKYSVSSKEKHITGLPYTFGADGFPIEKAITGKPIEIVNPNNGKTYIWDVGHDEWWDKENPPELYVPSDEELKDIAAAYSASFK